MDDVLDFWFKEIDSKKWWVKVHSFDQVIKDRFLPIHTQAVKGELYEWRQFSRGRLAEIIIIDQFSRNIFRDQPESFAFDGIALTLAQEAIANKVDLELMPVEKSFLYMPFMHSESLLIHEKAMELYDQPGLEYNLDFEKKHKMIIENFGRYPHRNQILGRESTLEEIEFLKGPNSSF